MKIQSIKSKLDPISRYVRLSFSTFPPFFSIMRKGPLVSAKGVKTPRGFCVKTVQGNEPDFLLVSLRLRLTKSTAIILKICGKSDFFSSFCWCRLSSPPNSLFLTWKHQSLKTSAGKSQESSSCLEGATRVNFYWWSKGIFRSFLYLREIEIWVKNIWTYSSFREIDF